MPRTSDPMSRSRVTTACDSCKRLRRKCDGASPCDNCARRGVTCTYSVKNGRRGPKPGSIKATRALNDKLKDEIDRLSKRIQVLEGENASLSASLAAMQASSVSASSAPMLGPMRYRPEQYYHPPGLSNGPQLRVIPSTSVARSTDSRSGDSDASPSIASVPAPAPVPVPVPAPAPAPAPAPNHRSSQTSVSSAPPSHMSPVMRLRRLEPSEQERGFLRTFFGFIVRNFPVIDRDAFYDALDSQEAGSGTDTVPVDAHSVHLRLEELSFRVCYYTALTFGAKLSGERKLARRYFELARLHIGPCFSMPCQHLVSALLIMTILTRVILGDMKQGILYASLAVRMVDLCTVKPEIRLCAMTVHAILNPATARSWPPEQAPPSMDPHTRLATLWAFAHGQVMHGLGLVRTQADATRFKRLVNECIAIQKRHSIATSMATPTFSVAFKSFVELRVGNTAAACVYARECIRLITADADAQFFVPLLYAARKAIAILAEFGSPEDAINIIPKAVFIFKRAADTVAGGKPAPEPSAMGLGEARPQPADDIDERAARARDTAMAMVDVQEDGVDPASRGFRTAIAGMLDPGAMHGEAASAAASGTTAPFFVPPGHWMGAMPTVSSSSSFSSSSSEQTRIHHEQPSQLPTKRGAAEPGHDRAKRPSTAPNGERNGTSWRSALMQEPHLVDSFCRSWNSAGMAGVLGQQRPGEMPPPCSTFDVSLASMHQPPASSSSPPSPSSSPPPSELDAEHLAAAQTLAHAGHKTPWLFHSKLGSRLSEQHRSILTSNLRSIEMHTQRIEDVKRRRLEEAELDRQDALKAREAAYARARLSSVSAPAAAAPSSSSAPSAPMLLSAASSPSSNHPLAALAHAADRAASSSSSSSSSSASSSSASATAAVDPPFSRFAPQSPSPLARIRSSSLSSAPPPSSRAPVDSARFSASPSGMSLLSNDPITPRGLSDEASTGRLSAQPSTPTGLRGIASTPQGLDPSFGDQSRNLLLQPRPVAPAYQPGPDAMLSSILTGGDPSFFEPPVALLQPKST